MSSNIEESIYDRSIRLLLHIYGIATAIALWVIVIYVIKFPESWSSFQGFQWYIVLATAAVTFLELIFILAYCPCCWCCFCCRHISGWIRAAIYAALTIPVFIFSRDSAFACVWAALLLILAFMNLLKSLQQLFQGHFDSPKKPPSTEEHKNTTNDVHPDPVSDQAAKPVTNYGATDQP